MQHEHVECIQTADAHDARLEIGEWIDLNRQHTPFRDSRLAPIAVDHRRRGNLFRGDGSHTADLSLVNRAYPQWRIGVGELLAIFQDLPHRWGRDAAERERVPNRIGRRNVGLGLHQARIGQRRAADRAADRAAVKGPTIARSSTKATRGRKINTTLSFIMTSIMTTVLLVEP